MALTLTPKSYKTHLSFKIIYYIPHSALFWQSYGVNNHLVKDGYIKI
jgi:hypothetical protein